LISKDKKRRIFVASELNSRNPEYTNTELVGWMRRMELGGKRR
jgi:hypothetical protein